MLLVIDNWAALLRDYEELTDDLTEIATAGLQHGVHLIVTAGRWAEIRPATREAFGSRLELRLNDPMESDFGRRIAETVPADCPGRGVSPDGLQFQVSLPRIDGRAEVEGSARRSASSSARCGAAGTAPGPAGARPTRRDRPARAAAR